MKIFTTENIRHIDDIITNNDTEATLALMERVASAVTYEIVARWRPSKRIVIFAGSGNNGGDALAVARMLYGQGYAPEIYLFNVHSSHLSQACIEQRALLMEIEGIDFTEIKDTFNPPELDTTDVVIDGLFGSGLRTPLRGGFTSLVQYINASDAYVVSLDIPSGMFGEWNTGIDRRNVIHADLTLNYQFPRLSFFFAENAEYIGQVKVLDLEYDREVIERTSTDFYLIEKEDVKENLMPRNLFMNKYDNGSILLVAGSYGMMGAAVLAARGAMRAGAGVVTVHAPRCGFSVMQTAVPEVLFEPDRNEIVTSNIDTRRQYSVVALGPGIGTSDETLEAMDQFLKKFKRPCLLDADALNCIARRQLLLRSIPNGSIITPHPAEFDRLFGKHDTDEERLQKAIDVSKLYEITIVLKGHYTMTVRPDGKVYINSTGNPGMATAGSGDVLTGIIASMIAQGNTPDLAVVMGVYLHGLAGDIAAREHEYYGLVASDIIDNLGHAFHEVLKQPSK